MRKMLILLLAMTCVAGMIFIGCGQKAADQAKKPAEPAKSQPAKPGDAVKPDPAVKADSAVKTDPAAAQPAQSSEAKPADTGVTAGQPAAEVKKNPYDVTKAMDWSITPARRTAIETAIPEAAGFIDGNEIVKEIAAKGIKAAADRKKLFAEKAKDKYIYFAAQTNPNPFNANASLNLIFGEGALMPDFMMVQLTAPKDFDNKKYTDMYGGTGYMTAFVGKLVDTENMKLEPAFDVFLPGYLK